MTTLFDSIQIGGLQLPNRAVLAPMTRVSAESDGLANELMRDYYTSFAQGEFGLLITEGTYTDEAFSQGYLNQPGLANEAQRDSWKPIVEAVHAEGSRMFAQLMHGGAQTQGNRFQQRTVGPSTVQPAGKQLSFYGGEGEYPVPDEMTEDEIQQVIAGFAHAARHAKDAGFDGVELHGANGYLLHEFISAEFNQRSDRWGGDIEGRLSLPLAVIEAVRREVGNDFIVGMRLSQGMVTDATLKWDGGVEGARTRFITLARAGLDFLHVTEGDASAPAFEEGGPSLSAIARECVDIPVIGNGSIATGEQANRLLEKGEMDMVAIGKAALANHDWPLRVRNDEDMTRFNFEMFIPMATLSNEKAWRQDNQEPSSLN
ncbi:oxidoreductase [Phytohalomonas tamaricis]|uniref:oxidoreductase n=1 Tax=Phytohalomonas tamaricis TaxID=2081032 RepID=UPI000D0B5757|nr:NADH:flavin oxidoreductase [Phytohalomonas tamaricis]